MKKGSITVYLNVFKKEDDQPDFRGKINIGDEVYDCALWGNLYVGEAPVNLSGEITRGEHDE